jgi:beta-phosphoglucomutase-like phosphatase (HAD superfamily)
LEWYRKNISGRHNEEICKDLFPDWSLEKCLEYSRNKEAYFREKVTKKGGIRCIEGYHDFLKFLNTSGDFTITDPENNEKYALILVVVTNACAENAIFVIESLFNKKIPFPTYSGDQIIKRSCPPFSDIFVVEERKCEGKPSPAPYANAMCDNNLVPEMCIAFEDSITGITSATKANGFFVINEIYFLVLVKTVVGFVTTQTHEEIEKSTASRVVNNWKEIIDLAPTPWDLIMKLLGIRK